MGIPVSRFRKHYFFAEPGSNDEASAKRIADILAKRMDAPEGFFLLNPPSPIEETLNSMGEEDIAICLGSIGRFFIESQENQSINKFTVVVINSPTPEYSGVRMDSGRLALYCRDYTPIIGKCDWGKITTQAYDIPWLQHGAALQKYALTYLLHAYVKHEDISHEVHSFMG